jgi:RimJ/RimL family protein N-acetyltransferase
MTSSAVFKIRPDIRLAPLHFTHAIYLFQWVSDPVVAKNIGIRSEPSLEKTQAWIEKALQDHFILPFIITLQEKPIGMLYFDKYDSYLATARLAVAYIGERQARDKGAGFSALWLGYSAAFEQWSLYKIWTTAHLHNFRALATYTNLGMKLEGIHRGEFILDNQRMDLLYLGVLREEFESINVEYIDR